MNRRTGIFLAGSLCTLMVGLGACTAPSPAANAVTTPVISTPAPAPEALPTPTPVSTEKPYQRVDKFLLETKRELVQTVETDYGTVVYSYGSSTPSGTYIYLDLVDENAVGLNLMKGVPQKDEFGIYPLPAEVVVDHDGALLHYAIDFPDRAVRNTANGLEELPTGTYLVEVDLPTYTITITKPDGTLLEPDT